jgi:hypothetical protein
MGKWDGKGKRRLRVWGLDGWVVFAWLGRELEHLHGVNGIPLSTAISVHLSWFVRDVRVERAKDAETTRYLRILNAFISATRQHIRFNCLSSIVHLNPV